jgi:uncharacterized membrane protein
MVLMTLDHVRDYLGDPSIRPLDMAHTTPALFLTRWITHLCAPTFFLLVGTGAWLALRHRSIPGLSRFLATRGLWLVLLEVTLLRCLGYQFNADYHVTVLFIFWALGWSMIALAALVWLRPALIAAVGLGLIVAHNAFDSVRAAQLGAFGPLWTVLHAPGFLAGPPHAVFVAYPLIPWIGVTALGFALGPIFDWAPERRRAFLLRAGLASIALFFALRLPNVYGDPVPWSHQGSVVMTVLSFMNVTKYPPSLLFLLMTLGPALLLLRALDGVQPAWLRPALVFGKVPLFYFVLHVPFIHLVALVTCLVRYGSVHWMFESPDMGNYPFTAPPGWGFSLPGVYMAWAFVVISLYPACRWYARVKQERPRWWMSYV